jgi:hypothetical protein
MRRVLSNRFGRSGTLPLLRPVVFDRPLSLLEGFA